MQLFLMLITKVFSLFPDHKCTVYINKRRVIGYWSLVIGYWALVIGHWSLVIGHWLLVIGHWSLVIGYWALVPTSDFRLPTSVFLRQLPILYSVFYIYFARTRNLKYRIRKGIICYSHHTSSTKIQAGFG